MKTTVVYPSTCLTCGRPLVDWRTCDPDDPAMDCGGDCWGCIRDVEEWLADE